MKTHYHKFKLTLMTLAPVHIGSGYKYSSREFIYENNKYYFPDMGQLYSFLSNKNLDTEFEQFLTSSHSVDKRLNHFLNNHAVKERDFGGYTIDETGFEMEKRTKGKLNDISKFMRNAMGEPYVPGSSLKGAIRTILQNTYWKSQKYVTQNKNGKDVENKQAIPWGAKRDQHFDDIFNEIRVGDSQILSHSNLIITQKMDQSKLKREPNPLPLFRESIKPKTQLEFEIITTSDRAALLIRDLGKFANEFYEEYSKFFLAGFDDKLRQANFAFPIYLGAGSGVWTKTIIKQADGIVQKRYQNPPTRMVGKGVMKLTKAPSIIVSTKNIPLLKNSNSYYEMGKACFQIKEVEI